MNRLVVLLLVLGAVVAPCAVRAQDPVTIVVSGPTAIAPASVHQYAVTVTGGPAATNGTFSIYYVLQGNNLAGGDPLVERPQANTHGKFSLNLTAPNAEGSIYLYVRAISSAGGANETTETRYSIDVFRPVELRATIKNNGAAAALNVTVLFYVDGALVGNFTIARIEAGGSAEANITYIPVNLAAGQHTVKVTADLDRDGVIQPWELQQSDFFYKTTSSSLPVVLGTVTVFLVVILVFVLLAIRRQRRLGG